MPTLAPPLLQDLVRHHAGFKEIEGFIEQLPISEEHRSALWLWARFSLPRDHSFSGHEELKRRLSTHDGPALRPTRHGSPALRPARRPRVRPTVK